MWQAPARWRGGNFCFVASVSGYANYGCIYVDFCVSIFNPATIYRESDELLAIF